jgi:Metallo-beta-lactamase superfamily.
MAGKDPIRIDDRIFFIDGFDMGLPSRTGTYVLMERDVTLIETGPSPSVSHVNRALKQLGIPLEEVRYIIVTHIHLDHAGGAGFLLQDCPNDRVIVHPKGARHLANPRKLIAGARAVYGERFNDFFEPILPVPGDRMLIKGDGDVLEIGPGCELEFIDTPGHARHHFRIYDPLSEGMFTGDTAGIRYASLAERGIEFYLPTTSPNLFDPKAMRDSLQKFSCLGLRRLYFGHFGMTEKPESALKMVAFWLDVFMQEAEAVWSEKVGYDGLADRIMKRVKAHLANRGVPADDPVYTIIQPDLQISALGIIDYLQKSRLQQRGLQ